MTNQQKLALALLAGLAWLLARLSAARRRSHYETIRDWAARHDQQRHPLITVDGIAESPEVEDARIMQRLERVDELLNRRFYAG